MGAYHFWRVTPAGYTGMIYGGPDWIRDIHRGIALQIRNHGLSNISEAVGSGLGWID